ncbi:MULTISPECIES: DNA polymerase III subunit alpha [Micrococcaceae]|uniref:DNA polymerase III subunit alpha n=1 Tax=Micrococcaceae TaxID=1268 RepID=UPI00160F1770|nr:MULTISPECIES: DNA polymerase III subunit alpha [Micrococcaceae]MBB5748793.1 error-prone DNA polymerase [Micrococcus sp. TA1]HRO29064.1 DNA polymerase III subunit alpha [Citricoccus sp.]HRO93420.1 DNA polymerase III subunit alpha [Citricoccus sp.]
MGGTPGFPHLHVASAFSAHYGVSWPGELAAAAAADGADLLACTDRDGLYGTAKHVGACREHGLDPVIGVDLAVHRGSDHTGTGVLDSAGRVVVLARGGTGGSGYRALVRLVSAAHAHTTGGSAGGTPYVTMDELAGWAAGPHHGAPPELFVLLGPGSDVGQLMAARRYTAGRALLRRWKAALPAGSLRVEVVCHLSPPGEKLSAAHAVKMLRAARDARVPAVLTNAVRYATPDGAATADVLDAARALSSLEALADLQPNGQGWLKPAGSMHQVAREVCRAAGAEGAGALLEATHALADACRMDPGPDLGWGRPTVPEASVIGIDGDPVTALRQRTLTGAHARFPQLYSGSRFSSSRAGRDLEDRLEHELGIITRLGFASYFLTVAEVVRMIEDLGVRVSARGSGASSLVNHLLRISNVDPMRHELIFERFLSHDRSTLPDIDVDVESARRHDVYAAIFTRFGNERTTLMSMQNGYRARGAVRDAGMALGMDAEQVDTIAKQLWRFSASSFREAMGRMPELRGFAEQVESGRAAGQQQLDLLVDLTERLDRLPRHIAMHPCGVILGDRTLLDRTPVQPSGIELPMSQFDKHDMDPMGMLKLDVLGVRMQSTIAYTLEEIERTTGERVDLERVPLDDEATFGMIRTTHTLGIFQIESPGQRELIGKLAPVEFNDLIIDISLFRPGPMQSDMVRPFLEQRHGFAAARYPHPDLEPVLSETHGVTVFHEQVLRTLDTMTGCGLAKADEFRRQIGGPQEEVVEAYFRAAALEKGYPLDVIDEVWGTLHAFGSFGFCKAHGAAFAVPTYHSAWLKTHHPEAFLAGIFEHDPGMYPRRLMIAEARRMGIPVLPVDINASTERFRMEWVPAHPELPGGPARPGHSRHPDGSRWGIRLALTSMSGLSEREVRRIVAGQPYASLADVRDRARPTRRNLERLAQLGALDCLLPPGGASRTDLVHHLELQHAGGSAGMLGEAPTGRKRTAGPRQVDGQLSLDLPDTETEAIVPMFPAPSRDQMVRTELDLTAMDTTAHLMDSHRPYLDALGVTAAEDLLSLRSQSRVLVAGVRVATQTPPMRSGKRVVFISVDDGTGCVDASFFTEAQHETGEMLFSARLLLIEGTTRRTGPKAISLQAIRAWDLHRPEALPDPDYLDSTREQWRAWLRRDRSAARSGGAREPVPWGPGARRRLVAAGAGSAPDAGAPRDIPHHDTGDWPVRVRGAVGLPPESSATGGDRRGRGIQGAGVRELDIHRPVPVPHPETWELLPTPEE